MAAIQFAGEGHDVAYRAWLDAHPTLFVLNTRKRPVSGYLILHAANSSCVARQNPTLRYTKICGTRAEIAAFLVRELGRDASSRNCTKCFGQSTEVN